MIIYGALLYEKMFADRVKKKFEKETRRRVINTSISRRDFRIFR